MAIVKTVQELIDALQVLPPDAQVVLWDSDTDWAAWANITLGRGHASYQTGKPDVVYLSGGEWFKGADGSPLSCFYSS